MEEHLLYREGHVVSAVDACVRAASVASVFVLACKGSSNNAQCSATCQAAAVVGAGAAAAGTAGAGGLAIRAVGWAGRELAAGR